MFLVVVFLIGVFKEKPSTTDKQTVSVSQVQTDRHGHFVGHLGYHFVGQNPYSNLGESLMEEIHRVDDNVISNNVALWHEYTQRLYSLLLSLQTPNDVWSVA